MHHLLLSTALSLAFFVSAPTSALAAPVVYSGSYVGTGSSGTAQVDYTITTDGTLGVIGAGGVVGATVTVSSGGSSETQSYTAAGFDVVYLGGLFATASDLFFDFSGSNALGFFDLGDARFCLGFYGPDSRVCLLTSTQNATVVDVRSLSREYGTDFQSGRQTIASSLATPVPEPVSVVLVIAGLAGIGATRRRSCAPHKIAGN
jgi:hypothetical protein